MSNLRKGIWFPAILVVFISIIALWFPFKYGSAFLYNRRLLSSGIIENAQLVKKRIFVDGKLIWVQQTEPTEDHRFLIKLLGHGDGEDICQVGVSKALYDNYSLGEGIQVTFLPGNPGKCKLSQSIPGDQSIFSKGLGLSAFMMALAFGSAIFILRSHKKQGPGSSSKLTTKIGLEDDIHCPKCNAEMTEGYLPMGLGIHWRNIKQPVGMPNIFGGLSGTVFWFKRPKLHAYHCGKCQIITFMYGKK